MAAPTKAYTFDNTPASTNVIDADEVNQNFDLLYDYLTAGVDTYAPGSIPAAAVASTSGILTDPTTGQKLSLIKFEDSPTLGAGGFEDLYDLGQKFPTAAVHVWATTLWFSDEGHNTLASNDGAWIQYRPGYGGTLSHIVFAYAASPSRWLYPVSTVFALGY